MLTLLEIFCTCVCNFAKLLELFLNVDREICTFLDYKALATDGYPLYIIDRCDKTSVDQKKCR